MESAGTKRGAQGPSNISDAGPRFGSTKLAAAITCALLLLVVLAALVLIGALPAQAQTETVLHNFAGDPDGAYPISNLTSDGAGNFYGTTMGGGLGYGTIFELSPNGSGGWNETVLYSFCSAPNCADGANPYYSPVIFDRVGNLYGTAAYGGANGDGVVFELSLVGGSWTETVLYSFCSQSGCTDGANPATGPIMDPAGNLYGTTFSGAVFELSPSAGGWTEQVIYAVETSDAGLTMDAAGNIFGVSDSTVFELSPNGNRGWNPTVIQALCGVKHPCGAEGTLVFDQAGNLYGTSWFAGNPACDYPYGCGTVFKLSPKKNGKWTEKILYSFKSKGGEDNSPWAGIVFDAAGNIYGTTVASVGKYSAGTVYELVAPAGARKSYKEKILWSFTGPDGYRPLGSLILDSASNLYGTTILGGSNGVGVVFEVTP